MAHQVDRAIREVADLATFPLRQVGRMGGALFRKRTPPPGAPPGTLAPHIEGEPIPPHVRVVCYAGDRLDEYDAPSREQLRACKDFDGVTWIDVQGISDPEVLSALGEIFGLHSLALADAFNIPQRPKVDEYEEHLFIVARLIESSPAGHNAQEQIALFVNASCVITVHDRGETVLDAIRHRIRAGKGVMRTAGPDYLAAAIIDAVIDGFFPALEFLGEELEEMQMRVINTPSPETLDAIYRMRRDLLTFRRVMWSTREAVNVLIRTNSPYIRSDVHVYLRDAYDHAIQAVDVIETYRELAGGLMDIYMSSVSNRMNEVMKVLTIMATVFIPLSFLAGVYGMNFQHMPELQYRWAYPAMWGVMVAVACGLLGIFWWRGWIGSRAPKIRKIHEETYDDTD